jgi:hypothetical protein
LIKTIEAVIDEEGNVALEPVRLASSHRAVVVISAESSVAQRDRFPDVMAISLQLV